MSKANTNGTVDISGSACIADILEALDLDADKRDAIVCLLPEGKKPAHELTVTVTAIRSEVIDEVAEDLEPEGVDVEDLRDFLEGVRCALDGDRHMAMILFGRFLQDIYGPTDPLDHLLMTYGRPAEAMPQLPLLHAA